jgi:hypothetical protein
MQIILKKNKKQISFDNKPELFIQILKFKGINIKNIRCEKSKIINIDILNNKYKKYIEILKSYDNFNKNISNLYLNNGEKKNVLENNYLNIISDKNKNKINKLNNIRYKKSRNIEINNNRTIIKYARINILKEVYNDIISRKISNKLLLPNYFFTPRYNEKSMPSQIKS